MAPKEDTKKKRVSRRDKKASTSLVPKMADIKLENNRYYKTNKNFNRSFNE
jgi:hypothetical protein